MARPGYLPMSPLSAAIILTAWYEAHGRWPCYGDCKGKQGLQWHTTYLKAFSVHNWDEVIAQAQALCSQPLSQLSALVHPPSAPPRLKRCCNAPECGRLIVDEGPHIRFCEPCKQHIHDELMPYEVGFLVRPTGTERRTYWGIGGSDWDTEAFAF